MLDADDLVEDLWRLQVRRLRQAAERLSDPEWAYQRSFDLFLAFVRLDSMRDRSLLDLVGLAAAVVADEVTSAL